MGYSGFKPYSPEALRPRCPVCGAMMRGTDSQYYCTSDSCRVQFVRITTREAWLEKRRRDEERRQREILAAVKSGLSYPSPEAEEYLKEHPIPAE